MSKGTKQIRSGRIASIITVLEEKIKIYNDIKELGNPSDTETQLSNILINNRIEEIESIIPMLKSAIGEDTPSKYSDEVMKELD